MSLLQAMTIACLLATGMGVALLGSVKVALARKLELDEARVGGLVSMFGFAMIPTMLLVGFVTDLIGKQPVMIGGSILLALSLVALARAKSYWPALAAVVLLSVAWATLINVVNPLSLFAFPGTEAYALNLACFFFGIGAFLTPLVVVYLLRRMGLAPALLILAGFCLLTGVLALGVDFAALTAPASAEAAAAPATAAPAAAAPATAAPAAVVPSTAAPAAAAPSTTAPAAVDPATVAPSTAAPAAVAPATADPAKLGIGTLLFDAVMWLCAFALFFHAPMEATMGAWATTYLGDKGVGEGAASWLLSGFWMAFTGSRLVAAYGLPAGSETTAILGLAALAICVWAVAVFCRGRGVAMAMVIAAGLVFGPIYPTIMAVLLGHFDASLHGRAVGLLFAVGGFGWTVIPMLIGVYAQRRGVQRGFLMAAASAVGLTVIAVLLHLLLAAPAA